MILDGKAAAESLYRNLITKIQSLPTQKKLVVIQVGENPASTVYINIKRKKAEELGIQFEHLKFESEINQDNLTSTIENFNKDDGIGGIILQLPLSEHLNSRELLDKITPSKDIDCLTSHNLGRFFSGNSTLIPATPLGIIRLLEFYNINVEGKDICLIGKSNLVGKPLAISLMNKDATVSVCHIKSKDIKKLSSNADIVITAAGDPKFFTLEYFKEGQVVIDVGMTKGEDGKLYGDVDFETISKTVKDITPVPGGVGPMTVYALMENFVNLNSKN